MTFSYLMATVVFCWTRLETFRRVHLKLIPAIVMTGHSTPFSEPAYNQGALSCGFQKFLAKPFNIDELLEAIAEFTRGVDQETQVYCCNI
ncbi:hypothetical protein NDA01_19945 [Trichocoleus desertorum AS-A10]